MTGRIGGIALSLTMVLLAGCTPDFEPVVLPAVPDLERPDPPVRTQFENAYQQASQALAAGNRLEIAETAGRLGMLFHAYDYAEPALDAYQIARGQNPTDPRWQYLYALIARQLGLYEVAGDALLRAQRMGSNTSFIELRLGEISLEQGKLDRAIEWFDRASVDPLVESQALAGLGLALLESGRPNDAISPLKRSLAADRQNATAMHALGSAYRATGDLAGADRYFREAQESPAQTKDSDSHDPFLSDVIDLRQGHKHFDELAARALGAGNAGQAIEYYRRALAASPTALDVRHNLAILLWRMGEREQALREFDRIFAIRPDYVGSHLFLGYELVVAGDPEQAEQHIRAAYRADPSNPRALALLADYLDFNNRHDEALIAYQQLVDLDPGMEKAWVGVVYSLIGLGRIDDAYAAIDAGLRQLPDDRALILIRSELRETDNDQSEKK